MITVNTYQKITKSAANCGWAPIYVSLYIGRKKIDLPTGVSIPMQHWNEEKSRILSKEKDAADKNLVIEKIQVRVNDVLVKARLKNKKLTKDSFMRAFNRPDDYDTFYEFITCYQKRLFAKNEYSTLKGHLLIALVAH